MSDTSKGIALYITSFFVAAFVDTSAKLLIAQGLPLNTVVFFRYAIAFASLAGLFLWRGRRPAKSQHIGVNLLRGALLTCSTVAHFYAVSHLPLALATSINFAAPLISCALAPFMLGEQVGIRRWAAVGMGFIGVLVVLRPGTASFHPAMFASLFNALVMALFQIFTRKAGFRDDAETGLVWVFTVGLTASVAALPFGFQVPSAAMWPLVLLLGIGGLGNQLLFAQSLRHAPATLLAPFYYVQILWMTLSGILLFNSWPDGATLLGASIIITSGIYVWHRERVSAARS